MRIEYMNILDIKLVATDCDGVLTDGGMYYLDSGDELKRFNVLDGVGFQLLQKNGIKTAIITASTNSSIKKRADKLGVSDLIMGTKDKLTSLKDLCDKYNISLSNTVYIGDDIHDVPAIVASGFGCVPGDALDYIKEKADYITVRHGGEGCFREVVDLILNTKSEQLISVI